MKQYIKNNVDTQLNNQCFGKFNMLDNVELEIKVLTNGDVGEAWELPTFELIGVKMDKNEVRQTEGFEVLSLTEHTVKVALDEQFTTKDGVLDMQLVVKDNGRVSTCIFSFVVGKSLEGNIVESIRKIDTLDDLDVVVANLRDYEQQIDQIKTEVVATNEDIKIEEAKRKQDELVRVTKETARANAETIRQVNEEMRIALYETAAPSEEERQANEETRMVNETNRKIAEQTRISNENSRILAEQNRNETFEANEGVRNLQENKRVANENARINKFGEFEKNEIIRLASENNRLIQELERVNNEENRINAEADRQAQEDNREATYTRFNEKEKERQKAEDARKSAEQQRVSAELLRDQNYTKAEANRNKLYEDCETQRNADFGDAETIRQETYATAEKERYTAYNQAELTRNQNEELRKNNESKRITNENTRIANEELRVQKEAARDAKVEEFLTRGEQTVIEIEQRTEEFLTRGEQVVSDIEKRTDAALGILEGSAEEVADMRIDYMGNTHDNMRQAANANVDYAVKTAIGEFNYLDYEGQHITANNSIEGHTKSAILKGNTLVNLQPKTRRIAWGVLLNDSPLPTNCAYDGFKSVLEKLKPSTKYIMKFTKPISDKFSGTYFAQATTQVAPLTNDYRIITTLAELTTSTTPIHIYPTQGAFATRQELYDFLLDLHVMVIEYQDGMENWDIPYFEGMQSIRMPVLTTTGKNLFDRVGTNANHAYCAKYEWIGSDLHITTNGNQFNSVGFTSEIKAGEYTLSISESAYIKATNLDNNSILFEQTLTTKTFKVLNDCKIRIDFFANLSSTSITTKVISNIQLERGTQKTSYEPFKSNILTVNEDVTLRSNGSVCDELDLLTGKLTQRIDEDGEILTQEVVKTVDLSDNVVYSYDSTTHYSCSSEEGSLVPTLSVKVPTDVQATIAQQRNTIQALESENEALKDGLIEANQYREDGDMDLLSNQWDIDFRLFEIEMALDVPMAVAYKIAKETDIMSRFLQAKTLILGGRYERSKMEYQLKRYLEAGQLTQEEYDELISLMDARELVE